MGQALQEIREFAQWFPGGRPSGQRSRWWDVPGVTEDWAGGSVAALEGAGGGAKVDVTGDGPGDGVTRSPWTVGRLA